MSLRKNIFMVIIAFVETWALMAVTDQTSSSIFLFIFFIMACLLFKAVIKRISEHPFQYPKRAYIVSGIMGGILSVAWLWVRGEGYVQKFDSKLFRMCFLIIYFAGLVCLFTESILLVYSYSETIIDSGKLLGTGKTKGKVKIYLLAFPIAVITWIPLLLYSYPGMMGPDEVQRLEGALGVRPLSNHHSVYHSLVMGFWVKLGNNIFGNINAGMALLSVTQLLAMAFTVSYLIYVLDLKGLAKRFQVIAMILSVINPYTAVYSIHLFKDSMFGMAVVLCTCALIVLTDSEHDRIGKQWGHTLIYVIAGTAVGVFRNNGWYAFIVSVPFLLWIFRKNWKRVFPAIGLSVIAVLLLRGPVMNYLNPEQPDMAESLAVPMQQLARVIYNEREIAPEHRELLAAVWDLDRIPEIMDVSCSDNLKNLFRNSNPTYYEQIENHLSEYLAMYIKIGLQYPKDYLDAFRDETCGFWFPDNLYGLVPNHEGVFRNDLGIYRMNLLPILLHPYGIANKLYTMVPIYGFIGSPGTLFWILMLCAGFCIVRGKSPRAVLYLLPFLISCTLFVATPASYEYRYAFYQSLGLPLFMMIPFLNIPIYEQKCANNSETQVEQEPKSEDSNGEEL